MLIGSHSIRIAMPRLFVFFALMLQLTSLSAAQRRYGHEFQTHCAVIADLFPGGHKS